MSLGTTSGNLGVDGHYLDPLWEVDLRLTDLEMRLLRTWEVRRLGLVSHAGAGSIVSSQTYSRLEHSLGLLVLVAHFDPEDELQRVAALLHDVGHLAFSHTFEGLAGLDHHRLGEERVAGLDPLLREGGLSAALVLEALRRDGGLLPAPRIGLGLDHLESFVRSGRAHGRLRQPPPETLSGLRIVNGSVDTDEQTAAYVRELVVLEAAWQTSDANVVASAVLRGLFARLLEGRSDAEVRELVEATDDQVWAQLLHDPRTFREATALRRDPAGWSIVEPGSERDPGAAEHDGFSYALRKRYLSTPLVDGRAAPLDPGSLSGLREPPWSCVVLPDPGEVVRRV